MEREIAEKLIKLFLELDKPLNEATELTLQMSDPEEQRAVRRGLAALVGGAYTDLVIPILRQYPDLDKDLYGQEEPGPD